MKLELSHEGNKFLSSLEKEELKRKIAVLESLLRVEKNQINRRLLKRKIQRAKIHLHGFNIDLLNVLVNYPPPYEEEDKIKESVPPNLRKQVLERDNYECKICFSKDNLVIHHVVPNGPAELENLVTLCRSCHMIVHKFLQKKGYRYYLPFQHQY